MILQLNLAIEPVAALFLTARQPGLRSLGMVAADRPFNDVARSVLGRTAVAVNPHGLGLSGHGETIAISDTGLDTGDPTTLHPDFRGRVVSLKSYPMSAQFSANPDIVNKGANEPPADTFQGHGTHVAGSAVGDGALALGLGINPPVQGMAPKAQLVFQKVEQPLQWSNSYIHNYLNQKGELPPGHGLCGVPDKLALLFGDALAEGARIHSISWGRECSGYQHDPRCGELDQFVWDHKDYLVVVAAGNDGPGAKTINAPGLAKNALTVGATENDRPGQFGLTYGDWWPNPFGKPPASCDGLCDSADHLLRTSSRGPCHTGRRKPDVLAPGSFIASTRSSKINTRYAGWAPYPKAMMHYVYEGGSSMSTALVAGAAALVREYLRTREGMRAPSAAMVKAVLVHSASVCGMTPAGPAWADDDHGWGRVDLGRVLNPASPTTVRFIDEVNGLQANGQSHAHRVHLVDDSVPLRATLVYTDWPGVHLIHNLNLILFAPGGARFVGNDFAGTGTTDSINNVEGVAVATPTLGPWAIQIIAASLKGSSQPYALVISGGF